MQKVKIKTAALLEAVVANRETHTAQFKQAFEEYRRQLILKLEAMAQQVKDGGEAESRVTDLPEPQDHTAEYDKVIRMLQMSADDVVELDVPHEFDCYVMDNWAWKKAFSASNSRYLTS